MNKEPLSILYDLSVLGMGQFSPTARTGIFRATENLIKQIAQDSNKFNLKFIASQNNYYQCLQYLNAQNQIYINGLKEIPKIHYYLDKKVNLDNQAKSSRLFYRGCRYMLQAISNGTIKNNEHEIDIFHSPYFPLPSQIKKKKEIVKFLTVNDLIVFRYPQYFTKKKIIQVKKALYSLSPKDFVICISQNTKEDFCEIMRFNPNQIFVIPLAASDFFFPCKDSQNINETKKKYNIPEGEYILSVGTIEPRKNIKGLITAFQRLIRQEKIDNLYLVLVGAKSSLYHKIFKEIDIGEDLKKRIYFTGYVSDQDLLPLYCGALFFIYLSLYEGFGLPALEAMKCGTPVLVSNNSSFPEIIGKAGIMVCPNDIDEICQHMLEIIRSTDLREQLSLKSIERSKKFSWEKNAKQTISAYQKAYYSLNQ